MKILGITQTVASLEKSKQFYEDILGFKQEAFYQPTRWLSFQCQEGVFFAVGEAAAGSTDEVAFAVSDIESFWEKVKDKVDVVNPLEKTPWARTASSSATPMGIFLPLANRTKRIACPARSM